MCDTPGRVRRPRALTLYAQHGEVSLPPQSSGQCSHLGSSADNRSRSRPFSFPEKMHVFPTLSPWIRHSHREKRAHLGTHTDLMSGSTQQSVYLSQPAGS